MSSLTASAEDRGGEDEQASDAVQQSLSDPEVPARPQAPLPVMETNLATSPPPEQQPRRLPQDQGQQHNNASLSLEELKAQERKQINTFISVLLVVLLVMIIVITGVVVGLHHKHRSNKSNAASSATAAPTPVPYTSDGRYQCFTGVDELKLAILYYRLDPTNQTLADMYGTPIGAWCTRPMKSLRDLLQGITTFNYDISGWDVSNVEDMGFLFAGAVDFNQPLNSWDTGKCKDFSFVFQGAAAFNMPLDSWNTSSATTMLSMFADASAFNQDISMWDVSRVKEFNSMFSSAVSYNENISSWDVGGAESMRSMFAGASQFYQNLCPWGNKLNKTAAVTDMFSQTGCSLGSGGDTTDSPVLSNSPPGPFCQKC